MFKINLIFFFFFDYITDTVKNNDNTVNKFLRAEIKMYKCYSTGSMHNFFTFLFNIPFLVRTDTTRTMPSSPG